LLAIPVAVWVVSDCADADADADADESMGTS